MSPQYSFVLVLPGELLDWDERGCPEMDLVRVDDTRTLRDVCFEPERT